MQAEPSKQEPIDPEVFIPEIFLARREFLVEVAGHGWGIVLPARELGDNIKNGRVKREALLNGGVVGIVYETAIPEDT